MAFSDCAKCWSTPCDCGWEFRGYSVSQMVELFSFWPKGKIQELIELLQKAQNKDELK